MIDGKPAVLIADLPTQENEQFQIVPLRPVRPAGTRYNNGLQFNNFRVPKENLLEPPRRRRPDDRLPRPEPRPAVAVRRRRRHDAGDAGQHAALGRVPPTYGQPIADARAGQAPHRPAGRPDRRRRRPGRLGLVADRPGLPRRAGVHHRQDLRQRGAEGSGHRAVHEDARRPVVPARPPLRRQRPRLSSPRASTRARARCSAWRSSSRWSRSTARQFFEPIGKALQQHQIKNFNPANPRPPLEAAQRAGRLRASGRWARSSSARDRQRCRAWTRGWPSTSTSRWTMFASGSREEISGAMRKHQLKLADRQCRMAELSQRVQDTVVMLVTALWGHQQKNEVADGGGRHPVPGPAPQADRRAADATATSATWASSRTWSSRAALRIWRGCRCRRS